jgi:hypothetical protein
MRLVMTGALALFLAAAFFIGMLLLLAPKSNDPASMMRTVGQVSGVLAGLGVALLAAGLIGKKA